MTFRLLVTVSCLAPLSVLAAEPNLALTLAPGELQVRPSFAAASFYFRPTEDTRGAMVVEFRRVGETGWQRAFEPVTDKPDGIWKGSVFDLAEDTAWQLRVTAPDGAALVRPVEFRTWSSQPRVARTIDLSTLPEASGALVISEQGSPDAWVRYTAPPGWRFAPAPGRNPSELAAITLRNARHVILENLTIVGGARHGVLVEDSDAVRILNCDISGWGRVGVQQFTNSAARGKYADAKGDLINYDGGIVIHRSAQTVVERCYLHDPRGRANSWMFSHPAGPTALFVHNTRGGSVVRWNDFVGSDEHRWNDVIEGSSNSGAEGGFFRDSDVSGNFLAFGNDDGVELEGGGMNVRFYRNKIEGTTCGISTGACILGPQFIFGNLVVNPGDEAGLGLWFFKNGHGVEQGGRRHYINNTLVGPAAGAYGAYGKTIGVGRIGYMRNNLFVCSDARLPGDWARRDDFDSDLFWAGAGATGAEAYLATWRKWDQERNGIALEPQFVAPDQGDFHLAAGSPARRRAAAVTNLAAAGAALGALGDEVTEVPFRPLELIAAPRQVNFESPRQSSQMRVTLTVPATAQAAVPFEIRQNRAAQWFKVAPASGVVAPGKSVTLVVAVDPAALRGRPRFRGAFLVRTPAGLSRPVSVYAAGDFREELRPASAPDSAYLEVAALDGMRERVRATDAPGVFGGRFVAFAGKGADAPIAGRFLLPRAGRYSLLARASVSRGVPSRLSFGLTLDDAAAAAPVAVTTDYQWPTGATHFRVIYLQALGELPAGEHRLRLDVLVGGLNLNELIITDNPAAFFIDEWQKEKS